MSRLSLLLLVSVTIVALTAVTVTLAEETVLEVLVVVDLPVKTRWTALAGRKKHMKKELYSTMREVDEIFKSLTENGVDLEVRVKEVIFAQSNILGDNSEGQVGAETATNGILQWVAQQEKSYDQALVLLGAEILQDPNNPASVISGYTISGATCSDNGVTFLTAGYDYRTARTIVQLLAMSMGVAYDGRGDGAACYPADGYVMSSWNPGDSLNRWSFSSCSAEQLRAYISDQRRWCLRRTETSPLSDYPRFGKLVGPEEACDRLTGNSLLRYMYNDFESEVCSKGLMCLDRVEGRTTHYIPVEAAEGTKCATGKSCLKGSCVEN